MKVRSAPVVLFVLAIVVFLAGSFLPQLLIKQMKPLSAGEVRVFQSEPSDTIAVDQSIFETFQIPAENAHRPECAGQELFTGPISCMIREGKSVQRRVTTTSEVAGNKKLLHSDTVMSISIFDRSITELQDHVLLDRLSAYPTPTADSTQRISVPGVISGVERGLFVRDGLQYFFPFTVERRSYPFYDPIVMGAVPLDYVEEVEHNGNDAYHFSHQIKAVPLLRSIAAPMTPSAGGSILPGLTPESFILGSGPAARFYSAENLERFGHAPEDPLVVEPYYSIKRDIWVEPRTGVILDFWVDINVYMAANAEDAEALAFEPNLEQSVFATKAVWDQQTLAEQKEIADREVGILRFLQVFAVLSKAAALLLALVGAIVILRQRTHTPV